MPEHDKGIWLVWVRGKDGVDRPTIQFDEDFRMSGTVHSRRVLLHEMQLLPPGQGVLAERLGRHFPLPPPDQRTP